MKSTLDFIKEFEGFIPVAKDIGDGVYTVGYGTTNYYVKKTGRVKKGDIITTKEATAEMEYFLKTFIQPKIDQIEKLYGGELPPKLKESLYSLAYNCGPSSIMQSIKRSIVDRDWGELDPPSGLCRNFLKFVRVGGEVWGGLVNRRRKEIRHFLDDLPPKDPPPCGEVKVLDI